MNENILVKRIFGVKEFGDRNWLEQCRRNSVDPFGVFSAKFYEFDKVLVQVGNNTFDTDLSYKTFERVHVLSKTLGDYL